MLCQKCKKNFANTIVSQTINGYTKQEHLCYECAKHDKYFVEGNFSDFNTFFKGLPFENFLSSMISNESIKTKRCPQCGSTFEEIIKSGKMGCGLCYETYENELSETLLRLHGRCEHIGKTPNVVIETEDNVKKTEKGTFLIDNLRENLRTSIEKEDFEAAAKYRDQIRQIEEK